MIRHRALNLKNSDSAAMDGSSESRREAHHSRPFNVSSRMATALGAIAFLAVVSLWGFRSYSVLNVPGHPEIDHQWGMEDFREAVYFPVRSMLDGNNPYNVKENLGIYPMDPGFFVYAPSALLFNLPFGLLPYQASEVAYFASSAAMIPLLAFLLLRCAGVPSSTVKIFWLAVFIAVGRPVYGTLTLGQGSLFIVLGVTTALHYARSNPRLSGLGFAIACMKPTFAIPLCLLMFFRRDLKALSFGVVIAGITCFIPTLVLAVSAGGLEALIAGITDGIHQYLQNPENALRDSGWMRVNGSIALVRLLGIPPVPYLGLMVAIAVLGTAAVAIHLKTEPPADIGGHSLSSTIIALATLVAVHHLIYDAILVLLPLVVLLISPKPPWNTLTARLRFSLGGLLICLWFNYWATDLGLRITGLNAATTGWSIVTSINSAVLLVAFGACLSLPFSVGTRQEP